MHQEFNRAHVYASVDSFSYKCFMRLPPSAFTSPVDLVVAPTRALRLLSSPQFMYVSAVEEFAPEWWKWPELGILPASGSSSPVVVDEDVERDERSASAASGARPPADVAPASRAAAGTAVATRVATRAAVGDATTTATATVTATATATATSTATATTAAATAAAAATTAAVGGGPPAAAPLQVVPNALAVGGWTALADNDAPARYRHACAVIGARLFVFGGRSNSGRLAEGLYQLDLLTGEWSAPATTGTPPDLRWGHSMNGFRQWCVIFGGHRRRGCLNDTAFFDTESHAWALPQMSTGQLPPPRGNHSAVVVADRLWLFGGDAANAGVLPHAVWALSLADPSDPDHGMSWSEVQSTGEAAPPSCDHSAVAIGAQVLLLGGSNASGYLSFSRIPVFHTDTLSWSRMTCGGKVPGARAGHVAACVSLAAGGTASRGGGGWQLYVFGGGNSTSGFSDMHVLRPDATWRRLDSSTRSTGTSQPEATEGAAAAQSGGMLLVFGGYTAAGATKRCYAWGCEKAAGGGAAGGDASRMFTPASAALGRLPAAGEPPSSAEAAEAPLVLLACPRGAQAQRHAGAAQPAFAERLGVGVQVVPTPSAPALAGGSAGADSVAQADSNEQALALMLHRLHQLQLQRNAFGAQPASLLSRAQMLAAVQPCVYRLMAGGQARTFVSFWVGVIDLGSGRQAVGSSLSREVRAEQTGGWGKTAHAPSELHEDAMSALLQAWKSLLRGL